MPKTVEWYRLNAERCRQLAQTFKDPEARSTLAEMADAWRMLAARRGKQTAKGASATPPALEHEQNPMASAATWQNAHTWRMRSAEVRALADDVKETEPKAMMLRIADDYDRLAEWAENNTPDQVGMRRSPPIAGTL